MRWDEMVQDDSDEKLAETENVLNKSAIYLASALAICLNLAEAIVLVVSFLPLPCLAVKDLLFWPFCRTPTA